MGAIPISSTKNNDFSHLNIFSMKKIFSKAIGVLDSAVKKYFFSENININFQMGKIIIVIYKL